MLGFTKFALLSLTAVCAFASSINISTGNAFDMTGVTTAGWRVQFGSTTSNAVTLTGTLPLESLFPGLGFGWVGAQGQWIGTAASDGNFNPGNGVCNSAPPGAATCGGQAGTYTYTLGWTSAFGGSFSITGFTGDNGVKGGTPLNTSLQVLVNSVQAFGSSSATQNAFAAGSGVISYGSGSTILIRAIVVNDVLPSNPNSRNPTGFILLGRGNENDTLVTPEPSTYAMLGLGLALMAVRLRRR